LVDLKIQKKGIAVQNSKKIIAINSENGSLVLEVTNEYGNSVRYEISDSQFDNLWSQLWQFVKDSQH